MDIDKLGGLYFMEKYLKAVRAQDIQSGLSLINSGLANLHMKKTKLIGATAQVCSLVEPFQVVDNYDNLIVAAGELGIDDNLLEKSLRELQEVEFIRLVKNGEIIKKIEVTIPSLQNRYEVLGQRYEDLNPSEIENKTIELLDDLAEIPIKTVDIASRYSIGSNEFSIIKDLGISAGFLDEYSSPTDSEQILFSPIYWDENPEKIIMLTDKYSSNSVLKAIKSIRDNQGKPIEKIEDKILIEAVANGCLPAPKVKSTAGEKQFLFSPVKGVQVYEKNLLNKARAIVACMRYGETFGNITKIKWPEIFLKSLLEKKYIRPHSEVLEQYSILATLGVGFADKVIGTDRYSFKLIETPENIKALKLAIQMVTVGTVSRYSESTESAKDILIPGNYYAPNSTMLNLKSKVNYSKDNVSKINDMIRGVSSELL